MYKILIVDDEPFILEGLRHIIDWEEYDLEIMGEASYGTEALEIIDKNNIDILITDIRMPFMDGFELIRRIRERDLDIKIIILSGYDDFSYVKEAVQLGIENYILKPMSKEELISTLAATRKKIENDLQKKIKLTEGSRVLRDNMLLRWVMNDITKEELLERMTLLGINIESNEYMVVIISAGKNGQKPEIEKIVNQVLDRVIRALSFPDLGGDIILIISDVTDAQKEHLFKKVFPEIQQKLKLYIQDEVFITAGSYENGLQNVYKSYSHARYLQDYRLIMPSKRILSYVETVKSELKGNIELKIDYDALCNFIILKKSEEALTLIEEFYNSLKGFTGLSPSVVYNITIEILFNITSTIKRLKGGKDIFEEMIDIKDMYVNILKVKNIIELKEWLKVVINSSIDYLSTDDDRNKKLIERVLAYIHNNYANEINLKTIASEFSINTAYLGQSFKKQTGESFTNYLNRLRVEKAIELMSKSNLKVNEISKAVGYYNISYYYTMFKKITGVSPNEYKVNSFLPSDI